MTSELILFMFLVLQLTAVNDNIGGKKRDVRKTILTVLMMGYKICFYEEMIVPKLSILLLLS